MTVPIVQSSPVLCYLGVLLFSYIPLSTLISNTLSLCAFLTEIPHLTPIQNNRQNYWSVYFCTFSIANWKLKDSGKHFLN
jgi:hypothetical protein